MGAPASSGPPWAAPRPAPGALRARFRRRLGAWLIDIVLVSVAFGVLELALVPLLRSLGLETPSPWEGLDDLRYLEDGFDYRSDFTLGGSVLGVLQSAAAVAYFSVFERRLGWTPGKRMLDLRVVRVDGRPLDWGAAFVRNLTKGHGLLLVLDLAIGYFAYGEAKQRASDHVARTLVVKDPRDDLYATPPPA